MYQQVWMLDCVVQGLQFCEYISFAGNETCILTSFSNDKMYAVADSVAWLHFAVFFALKKMVSIYINFLSTGANNSRFEQCCGKSGAMGTHQHS
jgi:hypothetical protein